MPHRDNAGSERSAKPSDGSSGLSGVPTNLIHQKHHIDGLVSETSQSTTSIAIGRRSHSRSDSMRSMTGSQESDDKLSIVVVLFLLLLVVGNFYFALSYSADSECRGTRYTVAPNVFTLLAGVMTLPMFITAAILWKKGRNPQNPQSEQPPMLSFGKLAFCVMFWNIVLATFGVAMFVGQFDNDCRFEPIAMYILLWSSCQFAFMTLSVATSCYLTYQVAAKTKGAEDILGAGMALEAA